MNTATMPAHAAPIPDEELSPEGRYAVRLVIACVVLGFSCILGGIIGQRIVRRTCLMASSLVAAAAGTFFYNRLLGAGPGNGLTISVETRDVDFGGRARGAAAGEGQTA